MKNIAIFASGDGSNAENIIHFFENNPVARVTVLLCNNKNAGVLEKAARGNVPSFIFTKEDLYNTTRVLNILEKEKIDLIVLAGFLLLIPRNILEKFSNKIVNIHPALLPKYGGSGMYGTRVHEAVIANHEKESGISIHFVNEKFDEGEIIFQEKCPVAANETPDSLSKKIHQLEHRHFPLVINKLVAEE